MDTSKQDLDMSKRTCGGGTCGVGLSGAGNGLQNFYEVANQHRPPFVVALSPLLPFPFPRPSHHVSNGTA